MSSIMRRRRGLISAIGGSCLWIGLRQPQSCQTGDLPHDDPPYLPRKRVSSIHAIQRIANARGGTSGERVRIGIDAGAGPAARTHPGMLLDQIERMANVSDLRVSAPPERQQRGRVVQAMRDDRAVRDQRMQRLPKLRMLLGKLRIERETQRQLLLLEQPTDAVEPPIDGILAKRLVDDIGVTIGHDGSEVRALP